jgi:integrase
MTRKEVAAEEAARWDMTRLWGLFEQHKSSLKSFKDDKGRWSKHVKPTLGKKQVADLVTMDVDRIRLRLLKTHSAQTAKHVVALIKRMVRFGVTKGVVSPPDPARLKFEMPKVSNQRNDHLSEDQVRKLLEVLETDPNQPVASMLKLALYTGLRKGEIFALKWSQVDFQAGFISLPDPKGGKPVKLPMNPLAREVLEAQPRTSSYVFPSPVTGGRRAEARRAINRIKRAAGIPDSVRPMHSLRHTYATILASSGRVDLYMLQRLMAHKSGQMTQRYAELVDSALKRAADDVADIFNNVRNPCDDEKSVSKKAVNLDDYRK